MFPPLRTLMVALWVSSLAGAVVIAGLSLGYVSWQVFALAGIFGLGIGVPAGLWNAGYIKRNDPDWPPLRRRRPGRTLP